MGSFLKLVQMSPIYILENGAHDGYFFTGRVRSSDGNVQKTLDVSIWLFG